MHGSSTLLSNIMHISTAPLPPSIVNWSSPEPMDAADALSRGQCNMIRVPGAGEAAVSREVMAALPGLPCFRPGRAERLDAAVLDRAVKRYR